MTGFEWFWIFAASFCMLAYQRAALIIWTISFAILMLLMMRLSIATMTTFIVGWCFFALVLLPLNIVKLRRRIISKPLLNFYRNVMPSMSRTEREALAAGTVTWEGDLFRGAPRWDKLLSLSPPQLSAEEQAFLDGPVEKLCAMIDDWDITHKRADMPPEMWKFLKEQGFFSFIIPKQYGGKEFSAYAVSQILAKVYGISATVASTIGVPNSLGPAELLLHYGTPKQKNYYLPRLATGEEIPCFALTGPDAGSDASAMVDTGVVCWGEQDGKKILGILLNFNKRYITLAPVATVIGLAFKLFDPEHLLGNKDSLGITCALIPRDIPNMTIGRRHFPLNCVFQNGPIHGKDVFIPADWIIGGPKMAGHGWRMLMECLATGRAISLPASSTGAAKMAAFTSGAYARIRRQFGIPIGYFEGVEAVLARIAGNTYVIDAARSFTAAAIDSGEEPSIASAIIKYHTTELGRSVTNDAMDVHGGKGICLGPNNYLGRTSESLPIAITVEGANILTRNMIIFGQGVMRCHPYIFAEFQAAQIQNSDASLEAFDKAIMGHIGFTISNVFRTFILSLTSGFFVRAPRGKTHRYFQQLTRFSAAFAFVADISIILLGGALKRKESISARLGDVLSYLYLLSAVLKHYYNQKRPIDDLPVVRWAMQTYLYEIQQTLSELLSNFPNRFVGIVMRALIFPWGKRFAKPRDKLTHTVAQLILEPSAARARITAGVFATQTKKNVIANVEDALLKSIAAEPIDKILKRAVQDKLITGVSLAEQAEMARRQKIITAAEYDITIAADIARHLVIAVDDFAPEDLGRRPLKPKAPDDNVNNMSLL